MEIMACLIKILSTVITIPFVVVDSVLVGWYALLLTARGKPDNAKRIIGKELSAIRNMFAFWSE